MNQLFKRKEALAEKAQHAFVDKAAYFDFLDILELRGRKKLKEEQNMVNHKRNLLKRELHAK